MMLWHKAWLESRTRLLLGVTIMTAVCAYSVYAHRSAYQGIVRNVFMVLCFLLGVGGLLRERAVGTAPFTLALPVSRVRLTATRAAVGWLELVALAFVPLLIALSLSPLDLFTVQEIMSGFRGPVPSTIVAALVVVTCALVASAVLVIDRKDFS